MLGDPHKGHPSHPEERPQTVWEKGTKEAFRDRPGQGVGKESRSRRKPGGRNGEGRSPRELTLVSHLGRTEFSLQHVCTYLVCTESHESRRTPCYQPSQLRGQLTDEGRRLYRGKHRNSLQCSHWQPSGAYRLAQRTTLFCPQLPVNLTGSFPHINYLILRASRPDEVSRPGTTLAHLLEGHLSPCLSDSS